MGFYKDVGTRKLKGKEGDRIDFRIYHGFERIIIVKRKFGIDSSLMTEI